MLLAVGFALTVPVYGLVALLFVTKRFLQHYREQSRHLAAKSRCPLSGFFTCVCSSADLDGADPPAVSGMYAATDDVAAAIVVVIVVRVRIVPVVVGCKAKSHERTPVKSAVKCSAVEPTASEASMKAATVKAASVEAAAMTAATASMTAATTASTGERRSRLSQADSCQCEQGYNCFPHHAFPPLYEVALRE